MNWDNTALLVRGITATVQGHAARTTTLAIDAGKRVTGITDPDGLGVGFGYDATFTRRIVRQRDRRGTDVHYAYGAAGKLASARLQMGPTANPAVDPQTGYAPEEAQGVAAAGATGAVSVAAMLAYTHIDGPRPDVADHTRLWMSRAGAVRRVRDALGGETFVQHDARFPALATRVTGPTGLVSRAHYDAFGRVDTATVENPLGDGRNQATVYQYDNRWHLPTAVTSYEVTGATWRALSGTARAAYNAVNGNVLWKQQGDDIARRTTFTYYTSGAAAGQLHTVAYPLGAQGQAATDTLTYDGRGNLRRVRSPTGMLTLVVRDSLGRDTLTISPLDESQARSETGLRASGIRQRTEYDGMDRPTVTETIGPAIQQRQSTDLSWTYKPADTPEERLRVQTVYDGEGLATQVIRQMTPDPGSIGNVQTLYEYDAAGRRWMESGSQGAPKTSTFDLAGNVVEVRVGTRLAATMQYDAANRLVRRTVPAVTHAVRYDQLALLQHVAPIPFPRFPNAANGALLIPEEHSYYRYDAAGNQVYAENADAIIRRGYYPNGALRGDTLQLRNYETAGYDQGYGLEYAYDLAGRVVSMSHPQNLAAAPNHRDQYGYDPTTGALAHATGRLGHVFQFQHDNLGRPTVTFMPGGVQDSVGYDGEGRPAWHRVRGPQTSGYLLDETMQYDGRGKLLRASNGASVYQQW